MASQCSSPRTKAIVWVCCWFYLLWYVFLFSKTTSKFQFDLENVSNYFGPLAFQFLGLSCLKTNILYIKRMTFKTVLETDNPVALTNWKVCYLPYLKKKGFLLVDASYLRLYNCNYPAYSLKMFTSWLLIAVSMFMLMWYCFSVLWQGNGRTWGTDGCSQNGFQKGNKYEQYA